MLSISEERGSASPIHERVLQNETNTERTESVDPLTGARTVTVIQTSVTQREVFLSRIYVSSSILPVRPQTSASRTIEFQYEDTVQELQLHIP